MNKLWIRPDPDPTYTGYRFKLITDLAESVINSCRYPVQLGPDPAESESVINSYRYPVQVGSGSSQIRKKFIPISDTQVESGYSRICN